MLVVVVSSGPSGTLASAAARSLHWVGDTYCVVAEDETVGRWMSCLVKEPCYGASEHSFHQNYPFVSGYVQLLCVLLCAVC